MYFLGGGGRGGREVYNSLAYLLWVAVKYVGGGKEVRNSLAYLLWVAVKYVGGGGGRYVTHSLIYCGQQ